MQIEPQALREFGAELKEAEALLDEAYMRYTALTSKMLQARRALGIGMLLGQETLASLDLTASKLMEARGEAVRAHKHSNMLRLRLSKPETAVGDCCNPQPGKGALPLKVVGQSG